MAVAHDGESNIVARQATATTWTISGKTTAGSNRCGVFLFMAGFAPAAGYPTWGGSVMTAGPTVARGSAVIRAYVIAAPPTSASNVVTQWEGGAPADGPYAIASFNGVDQTTPIRGGSGNTATGTSTTPSVAITSQTGDMVIDAVDLAQLLTAAGAGQTEIGQSLGGSEEFGASYEAGASTVTMSWSGNSAAWSILGFSLAASGGGGGGTAVPVFYHHRVQQGMS